MPGDARDAAAEFDAAPHPRRALLRHRGAVRPRRIPRRTCCPARRRSARRWRRSASAATTASSSMTTARCAARRAAGSCCAIIGADRVAILDGGLAKWRAEGRPVEHGDAAAAPRPLRRGRARRRSSPRTMLPTARRPDPRRARPRPLRRQRARSAPRRRRRATSPARATCRSPTLYRADGTLKSDERARRRLRRGRGRPAVGLRRDLRLGRHRRPA